jgi:hypothetical protein
MTISISGGLLTEVTAITGNTRTSVFTAERSTMIVSIVVTPKSGTPNLTVSRFSGAVRTNLRTAVAMTAGVPFTWEIPFILDPQGEIEVTSSASGGDMDVMVTYLNPVAPAVVRSSA